jgi:hypothetical protein
MGILMSYRIRRVDQNQSKIVERFRGLGAKVAITSSLGNGFPDACVGLPWLRKVFLVEIKDGKKPPSARKLTEDEQKFFDEWEGCVHVVNNEEEATELFNRMRDRE